MIALNYPSLLSSDNVKAAIRVIREGESWNSANPGDERDEQAFRVRYGGAGQAPKYFDSFDAHPQIYEPTPTGQKSSAAGIGQITFSTWSTVCMAKYGLGPDFKPYTQLCAIVALIHHRGALEDVLDGNFDEFLRKCGPEWASLPGSPLDDGGGKMSYARALACWKRFGGGAPSYVMKPAPVEDRSTQARPEDVARINATEEPMAFPILAALPLISSLIEAFSPIARAKVQGALGKQGLDANTSGAVADSLMDIVKQLAAQGLGVTVGPAGAAPAVPAQPQAATDPLIAVATVKANPALLAEAEAAFVDYFDKLAPMLDQMDKWERGAWAASEESMDRAAARGGREPDGGQDKLLTWAILILAAVVLLGLGIALGLLIYFDKPYGEVLALFASGIGAVWAKFGTRYDHRYGSSRTSQTKDFAIAELSARKQ